MRQPLFRRQTNNLQATDNQDLKVGINFKEAYGVLYRAYLRTVHKKTLNDGVTQCVQSDQRKAA